jgi:hypothetical protein
LTPCAPTLETGGLLLFPCRFRCTTTKQYPGQFGQTLRKAHLAAVASTQGLRLGPFTATASDVQQGSGERGCGQVCCANRRPISFEPTTAPEPLLVAHPDHVTRRLNPHTPTSAMRMTEHVAAILLLQRPVPSSPSLELALKLSLSPWPSNHRATHRTSTSSTHPPLPLPRQSHPHIPAAQLPRRRARHCRHRHRDNRNFTMISTKSMSRTSPNRTLIS